MTNAGWMRKFVVFLACPLSLHRTNQKKKVLFDTLFILNTLHIHFMCIIWIKFNLQLKLINTENNLWIKVLKFISSEFIIELNFIRYSNL